MTEDDETVPAVKPFTLIREQFDELYWVCHGRIIVKECQLISFIKSIKQSKNKNSKSHL